MGHTGWCDKLAKLLRVFRRKFWQNLWKISYLLRERASPAGLPNLNIQARTFTCAQICVRVRESVCVYVCV